MSNYTFKDYAFDIELNSVYFLFVVLKLTFDTFDIERKGYIGTDMIGTIMDMLGTQLLPEELDVICVIF